MAPVQQTVPLRGVAWQGGLDDGVVVVLDQTHLPGTVEYLEIRDLETLRSAIVGMAVRGAPAIGIASAYGLVLHLVPAAQVAGAGARCEAITAAMAHATGRLLSSRPTAVNLRHALERMRACFQRHLGALTALEMCARLLMEAKRIHREDAELCLRISHFGATLLPERGGVYTHCNTGALATGGMGTALGCIVQAHHQGKSIQVFAGETRPLLQGARLTAPELRHAGVPVTLVCDSMAALLMARGQIQAVVVGADRIAANGDTANKIGTYGLAILARHHGIPFYVAASTTTFDMELPDGSGIIIEDRDAEEVRRHQGTLATINDMACANPAFDVTPAHLITAIVTERGIITRPSPTTVARMLATPPA